MNTVERLLNAATDIWKEYNRLTEKYTEKQTQHLVDIFVACSRYELAFWEMAWNLSE